MKRRTKKFFLVALLFIFFTISNQVVAQIDCTTPTITYDMVAANAARSGATNPTLTVWPSAQAFSWETNSTASLLATNANVTAIHAGVTGTNVFYGSNNNIPADLISNQIFNLYRGPVTLAGRFLNFTASTQFDESYLSIIPSTYTNAVPVGQAGAVAVNSRIGISVGGSVGSANLFIYDNLSNTTASTIVASAPRPAAMTTNTWYTLSTTFDIKDGSVVITNVSVNGTSVGFTYPVVIGSSYHPTQAFTPTQPDIQTYTWVNSLRAVASVDDLLDDFTITINPCYSISGTVFNDANGLTDATVNGTPIHNPAGQLYAVLVDENEKIVGSYATVANPAGTYSFSGVPGGIFEVRLTNKVPGAAGTDAPPSSLPVGWINTGENIGLSAGNDGSPNGSIVVGTAGATQVNFGIQPYTASTYSLSCSNNVLNFDMIPENAQISHSANQSATGANNATPWSAVTNRFIWESFGTDANLYGMASAIPQHAGLTGINNPTNVFYGGVWQNASRNNTGQISADFISKQTFSLSSTSGPLTLEGRFLNKSSYTEDNESYVFILPDDYIHFQPMGRYDPPGFGTQNQRQGIFVGGNISTGLSVYNNNSAAAAGTSAASLGGWGGLAPAANAWYTLSATFDVQGANLVVTNVKVNGTTAAFTYPVVIGTVAANSWISNFRVAASVDDLLDDFTIATNPCIFGNVFYDANGFTDGIVNGIGMDTAIGAVPLSVVLVNGSGNVAKKSPVAVDGTYSMQNVYPANYTMRLTAASYAGITIGSPAPSAALPGGWINTGEFIAPIPGASGSDGIADGNLTTIVLAAGRNTGATTLYNVNFGIQNPNAVLPVSLIDFRAVLKNSMVSIGWVTASETNNDHFVIEKSGDGNSWQQLAIVKAKGNSNSNSETYYYDTDNNPFAGKNFYRLKQVDIDGKFSYSKTVVVNRAQQAYKNNLSIMPNPVVNNSIQLSLSVNDNPRNSRISIYDINGRLQKEYAWLLNRGVNKITLTNINNLTKGIYQVTVKDLNGHTLGRSSFIK